MTDAEQIRLTARRPLGAHLGASRAYYVDFEPERNVGVVSEDYHVPGLPSLAGVYPFEAFRSTYERIGTGEKWVVADVRGATEIRAEERDFYIAQEVVSWANIPLAKGGGRLEATLCVVQTTARQWTVQELALIENVAERLWAAVERARAEAALRKSEQKYRALFASVDQGFALVEAIQNGSGKVVDYRCLETNPAVEKMYGLANMRGKLLSEFSPGFESYWTEPADYVLRTGEPTRMENYNAVLGRWYRVHFSAVGDRSDRILGLLFEDITERKQAD